MSKRNPYPPDPEEVERKHKRKRKFIAFLIFLGVLALGALGWAAVKYAAPAVQYKLAEVLRAGGRYESAEQLFARLGSYQDATVQFRETRYRRAVALEDAHDYPAAAEAYITLRGYRDVDQRLAGSPELTDAAEQAAAEAEITLRRTLVEPGAMLTFGHYEQDNNDVNGPEPIEWIVLDSDGTHIFVISRYSIDSNHYNDKYLEMTWEICDLRAWLNDFFLSAAFTPDEQARILLTTVDNSPAQGYFDTDGGADTQDRIFLLSYAEAIRYFPTNDSRISIPTAYAKSRQTSGFATRWWLRSPGDEPLTAGYIHANGAERYGYVGLTRGVRPAMWIDLTDDGFQPLIAKISQ